MNATKQMQIKNEIIKTNEKRDWERESINKIVFDDLKFERSFFFCFYRVQMMWKITLYIFRMFSREDGTMYE